MSTVLLGFVVLIIVLPTVTNVQAPADFGPSAAMSESCCGLSPSELRSLYGPARTAMVPMIVLSPYRWSEADILNYADTWGLPRPTLRVSCTSQTGGVGCRHDLTYSMESTLNAELLLVGAEGADILQIMPSSPSWLDMLQGYFTAATEGPVGIVLTTWVACEGSVPLSVAEGMNKAIELGRLRGQNWIVASGDGGSRACPERPSVTFPAGSPHVLSIGGTSLSCTQQMTPVSPDCTIASETGWSGSGGGVSERFEQPIWQEGCGTDAAAGRLVPDLSLSANPEHGAWVYYSQQWRTIGGTSVGTPIFSGYAAGASEAWRSPRAWYAACEKVVDITAGSNFDYTAKVGYDLVTGLGSPRFSATLDP